MSKPMPVTGSAGHSHQAYWAETAPCSMMKGVRKGHHGRTPCAATLAWSAPKRITAKALPACSLARPTCSFVGSRIWLAPRKHVRAMGHRPQAAPDQVPVSLGTTVTAPGADSPIRWGTFVSEEAELKDAVEEAVKEILQAIGQDAQPELALVFVSSVHGPVFELVVPMLRERLPSLKTVFGCSGYGVVGGRKQGPVELEGEHGFSLTLGQLPGTEIRVLHTLRSSIPNPEASPEEWGEFVGVPHDTPKPVSFLMFADARFAQVRELVAGLDYAFPNAPKLGAILSSGTRSKSRAMWAWSAAGPAVSAMHRAAPAARAGGRAGGGRASRAATMGLRGVRRGRSLADISPQLMAAAVMAIEGVRETEEIDVEGEGVVVESEAADQWVAMGTGKEMAAELIKLGIDPKDLLTDGELREKDDEGEGVEGEREAAQVQAKQADSSERGPVSSIPQPELIQLEGSEQDEQRRASGAAASTNASSSTSNSTSSSTSDSTSSNTNNSANDTAPQPATGWQAGLGLVGGAGGLFGSLMKAFGGGNAKPSAVEAPPTSGTEQGAGTQSSTPSPVTQQAAGASQGAGAASIVTGLAAGLAAGTAAVAAAAVKAGAGGRRGEAAASYDEGGEALSSNGMYLYGAVTLAIHGDVQLDTITSMGYRAPSPRVWRIQAVASPNVIVSLVPEQEVVVGAGSRAGEAGPRGAQGPSRGRSSLMSSSIDFGLIGSLGAGSGSDSDSDDDVMEGGNQVQAVAAVVDMLEALHLASPDSDQNWDDMLDGAVVAVAADSSKPVDELGPEDWELLPLQEIMEDYGALVVGAPPAVGSGLDLRVGHRVQLRVRDRQGVREDLRSAVLGYKRRDLAAMMRGRTQPPTFGVLLFTDVDRGMDCYDEQHYESREVHTYMPAPTSGVFGGAQIGPVPGNGGATGLLEYSAVVGVLRGATDRSSSSLRREALQRKARTEKDVEHLRATQAAAAAVTQSPPSLPDPPLSGTAEVRVQTTGQAEGQAEGQGQGAEAQVPGKQQQQAVMGSPPAANDSQDTSQGSVQGEERKTDPQ